MITKLSVKNFKSWRDTGELRLAPITGLFGTNSSGKTSILQLLLLLRQTADSPDRTQVLHFGDDRSPVDLGTFPELVHAHDTNRRLEWSLEWDMPAPLKVASPDHEEAPLFESGTLGFAAQVAWRANGDPDAGRPVVQRMAYSFCGHEFGMHPAGDEGSEYRLLEPGGSFRWLRSQGRVWPLPAPAKCYGFPDQVRARFQNAAFLSDFELGFEQLMSRLFYLGPLRDHPKRQYSWAGDSPQDMGRRGEKVVDALLAAEAAGQLVSRGKGVKRVTVQQRVAQWLKELDLITSFEVRRVAKGSKLFQVWVRRSAAGPEVLLTDVGFGVSQILPVLTLCYYAPPGATILLEQPEIHLHPSVQSGMADVFIDAAQSRGVQIVLESHSEHLLRRLQRRVAEGALPSDRAALHFCRMEQGVSRIERLQMDLFGRIANWPENFFGDGMGEIAATSKAALRRRRESAE